MEIALYKTKQSVKSYVNIFLKKKKINTKIQK